MKEWRLILYGLLIGLLSTGAILLISKPERGAPIMLSPPPTPTFTIPPKPTATTAPMLVQIGGKVKIPGVYSIPSNARLRDLIDIAGGLTIEADQVRINFAHLIQDGDYFFIPGKDEIIPETARNSPNNSLISIGNNTAFPLNINDASPEDFESLPGIGPTKAADIVAYRERYGSFGTIDDLLNIAGIGTVTLEAIKELIVVIP